MPAFVNWLLRLLPTNPICMRLVTGGSKRARHLYLRSGYLAVMIVILLFAMLNNIQGTASVRDLASGAATTFSVISYIQVGLICLLTPVFMAGAIAQEANPKTWDILLTTPLNSMQIVLGNLFGRLFFILALLFSTLPLFAVTQYFGGVPGQSILASYAIAGSSSLLVAAIAITLCVNRTAGRRAVFWFYSAVVMYLFVTYAIDLELRVTVVGVAQTTVITPLNPFLALEVLLKSNTYVPWNLTGEGASWLTRFWMSTPITAFCWLCSLLSLFLIAYSTLRVRIIGARVGSVPWYRKLFGLSAQGAIERPARHVGVNPIAWRESVARGKTLLAMLSRWGFVAIGIGVGLLLIALHASNLLTTAQLRSYTAALLVAEVVIIALIALNLSATAVTREREDGTLDLILTTPIQPGPYLNGKMRGLIQYLVPIMLVPIVTMAALAIYVMAKNLTLPVTTSSMTTAVTIPAILPEGAIVLPVTLIPFIACCVMAGLHWSVRSKGTISAVIFSVAVIGVISAGLGLCAAATAAQVPVLGVAMNSASPVNAVWSIVYPETAWPASVNSNFRNGRITLVVGAMIVAACWATAVYLVHTNIKRNFMMTVRRLSGAN